MMFSPEYLRAQQALNIQATRRVNELLKLGSMPGVRVAWNDADAATRACHCAWKFHEAPAADIAGGKEGAAA